MPYIKYLGGRLPDSVSEQVGYENPNAPCYEGLAKLFSEARRFAEGNSVDTKRGSPVLDYVDSHSYPGMEHVGGVGFITDNVLRPVDQVITEEEYQQLRDEIERANQEYRIRKAEELSANNDPLRRAPPEHESLGWRTRVWVASYTELEHHVAYPLDECSVAYLRMRQQHPIGFTLQLIDIYHSAEGTVEQALLEGTDWAEMLVDLLALVGYGAAHVENVVGTTVPYCRIGEEFQLATFGARIVNTPVPVRPDQLGTVAFDPVGRLALRHLRDGLSAPVPTVAFAAFWNALECQAEELAKEGELRRIVKCPTCGAERTAGWDLKRSFEAMYIEAGLNPSLFEQHRSKRGIIQHGAKLRTTSYVDEVVRDVSQVQTAAMVAVAKKIGIAPATITYLSTSWPVVVFSCHAKEDGTVNVEFKRAACPVTPGLLPQSICGEAGRKVQWGVPLPPEIDSLALPPLQQ
jgi:hypothetical protein